MEDRVKTCPPADGKIEAEGHVIDCGEDGERTVAPWSEFQGGSEGRDIPAFKPHLITDMIGHRGRRQGPGLVGEGLGGKKIRAKRR